MRGAAALLKRKSFSGDMDAINDADAGPVVTWADVLLHARGNVGETALHLCCLLHTPQHIRLLRVLIPWLAKQKTSDVNGMVDALDASYLGQHHRGEVALHLAVSHQDLELVQLLVEHGASLQPHASGDFLYSSSKLYFGGTILGFAACLDDKAIVDFLLQAKADVNATDAGCASSASKVLSKGMVRGNSVLHCCVLHGRADMYSHLALTHKANKWAANAQDDTASCCEPIR